MGLGQSLDQAVQAKPSQFVAHAPGRDLIGTLAEQELLAAERAKTDAAEWDKLNNALINLSKTLQREAPQPPAVSVDADPRR
jgi:hypothetical protein